MINIVLLQILIVFFLAFLFFLVFKVRTFKLKEVEDKASTLIFPRPIRNFAFWLVEPIMKFFIYFNIPPNLLTVSALFVSFISAFFYGTGRIVIASWVLALSSMFDALDGRIARKKNITTKKGDFLDSSLDRISDGAIFFGVIFFYKNSSFMFTVSAITLISTMNISYFKAKAESLGIENCKGMMQRPERLLVLGVCGVLSPYISSLFNFLGFEVGVYDFFNLGIIFLGLSTFLTSIRRLIDGYKQF